MQSPLSLVKNGGLAMIISYDKLWKLMRVNKMKKQDLAKAADLSAYTMAKLGRDETVSMDAMLRLCKVFHCNIGDLMDAIEDE